MDGATGAAGVTATASFAGFATGALIGSPRISGAGFAFIAAGLSQPTSSVAAAAHAESVTKNLAATVAFIIRFDLSAGAWFNARSAGFVARQCSVLRGEVKGHAVVLFAAHGQTANRALKSLRGFQPIGLRLVL